MRSRFEGVCLGWGWVILFILLILGVIVREAFGADTKSQHPKVPAGIQDSLHAKYGYVHGDLLVVYVDRSHDDFDDTVVMMKDDARPFDVGTLTLCGVDPTKRLNKLVGHTVMLAYDRKFASRANKCHELIGILPMDTESTEPAQ